MPQHTPEEQARNQGQAQGQAQPNDLGQSLEQPQPVGASPSFRNAVDGFFQDPVNRAGLLSFGLNMLSGGFGTPLQQFAHAAGQGIESAAGAEEFQTAERRKNEAQDLQERGLAQRGKIAREAQKGQTERALIAARARIEAAGIGGSSLANKAMSAFTNARKAALKSLNEDFLNPNKSASDDEKAKLADQAGQRAMDAVLGAVRQQFGSEVNPGDQFGAGETRPNIPGAAPPAQPPPGAPPPETNRPNLGGSGQLVPFSQFRQSIQAQPGLTPEQKTTRIQRMEQMKLTPEGQQQLRDAGIDPNVSSVQGAFGNTSTSGTRLGVAGSALDLGRGVLEGIRTARQ